MLGSWDARKRPLPLSLSNTVRRPLHYSIIGTTPHAEFLDATRKTASLEPLGRSIKNGRGMSLSLRPRQRI